MTTESGPRAGRPMHVYIAASQPRNTIAARYVRLVRIGKFELALTWVPPHRAPSRRPVDP